jgi:dipeptidyl aminopeptidase/acylaminoacyl peptidase
MRNPVVMMRWFALLLLAALPLSLAAQNADVVAPDSHVAYQHAPKVIRDVLDAAPTPDAIVSPTRDRLLLVDKLANPPISDLSSPMLRIAGLRINPATNGRHHPPHHTALRIVTIVDGKEMKVAAPAAPWLSMPEWSPDGQRFAFTNTTANAIELWVGDANTAAAHKIGGVAVNGIHGNAAQNQQRLGDTVQWMPDSRTLLVQTVFAGRGRPPADPAVPEGPNVQESAGKVAPVATYEDLIRTAHDEDLFEYYATAQLAFVDAQTARVTSIGKPAIFGSISPSPDGAHILVLRWHRPFSHLLPESGFPHAVEVWDRNGKLEHKVAEQPSYEGVPLEGVQTGPRDCAWRSTAPATLVWAEAQDGGDTRKKVPYHDALLMLAAPFTGQPVELARVEHRFTPRGGRGGGGGAGGGIGGFLWFEKGGMAIVSDYDRSRRWARVLTIDADHPGQAAHVLWERSSQDRYNDPGNPVMRTLSNGRRVIWQNGNSIFLRSTGASQKGDFPFLDRYDLTANKAKRIFRSEDKTYEAVEALLSDDSSRFLTRYETPNDAPNYFVRTAGSPDKRALTRFPDPAPALRGIRKQIVAYQRNDGVQLSFTLYLPPDYKEGTRLPTVLWAYPLEFSDAGTAGQISGSQYRFTTITGYSHLFLLTQGYAVLDNATMPVIGDPETMNNTYVEQITASAKAAIDKAVEMGVTDRNRLGVGGHSYGAFMTANLLAHSDLFRAGVARSGAYNRTLTPFGFQSERRTFWEAPEMYLKVSPFAFADKIKTPILLIHGEADDNSGTFPIQSERMYQAIKGNGGTVRYVTLPHEAHGYQARETTEHVLWEMINWYDKWVKNPGEATTAAGK